LKGHEHLDAFGLINANARMYEPSTGRFLSPDSYVQAPSFSQNFNRYSYCWNNPLIYTDPDGEFIFTTLAAIFCPPLLPYAIQTDIGWMSAAGMYTLGAAASPGGLKENFSWKDFGYAALCGGLNGAISSINPLGGSYGPFSYGIQPSFMVSCDGISFGLNFQAGYKVGDLNFGVALGMSYGKSEFTSKTGPEIRLSGFAGYDNGNFGIGLSSTQFWSGETSQRTGRLSLRYSDFSLSYENDGTPFQYLGLAGGTDHYRTASVTLGYNDFTIGMLLFTGHRDYYKNDYSDPDNYPYGMVSNPEISKYNAGILYAGYGNMRVGWNHDTIRHVFQNQFAHGIIQKQPWIPRKNWPNQPYFVYGTYNPFTNW